MRYVREIAWLRRVRIVPVERALQLRIVLVHLVHLEVVGIGYAGSVGLPVCVTRT